MNASEKSAESGVQILILHSLRATARTLTPLLLALAAVWALRLGIGAEPVTLAQGDPVAISADPLAPHPIVVSTIPVPLPSPLIQAAIAINPATGYAYVLSRSQYTAPPVDANLTIISGTEVVASSTSPDYGGALAVNSNRGQVYMPVDGGVAVISGTEVVEVIPVDATLTGRSIAVAPSADHIYVDGYNWAVACIPEAPWCGGLVWILVDGWKTRLNVSGRVETIDLKWTLPTGHRPGAVSVNSDAGYVYVVNYEDATISVIREMILPHRIHLPLVVRP